MEGWYEKFLSIESGISLDKIETIFQDKGHAKKKRRIEKASHALETSLQTLSVMEVEPGFTTHDVRLQVYKWHKRAADMTKNQSECRSVVVIDTPKHLVMGDKIIDEWQGSESLISSELHAITRHFKIAVITVDDCLPISVCDTRTDKIIMHDRIYEHADVIGIA